MVGQKMTYAASYQKGQSLIADGFSHSAGSARGWRARQTAFAAAQATFEQAQELAEDSEQMARALSCHARISAVLQDMTAVVSDARRLLALDPPAEYAVRLLINTNAIGGAVAAELRKLIGDVEPSAPGEDQVAAIKLLGVGADSKVGGLDTVEVGLRRGDVDIEPFVVRGMVQGATTSALSELNTSLGNLAFVMGTLRTIHVCGEGTERVTYQHVPVDAVYTRRHRMRTRFSVVRVDLFARNSVFLETPLPHAPGSGDLVAWAAARSNILDYRPPKLADMHVVVRALNERDAVRAAASQIQQGITTMITNSLERPDFAQSAPVLT